MADGPDQGLEDDGAPPGGGGAAPGGGGPPPGPQGGGPIMAAMARRQGAPGVSAPGPGNTADSMGLLQTAYGLIQQALPGFQAGTPQHTSILRVMQLLSRHMGQGAGTEATQKVQLMDLMREGARNAVQQQMLRMQQQGGNQGPQAPMPSTALPGA